MYGDHDTRRSLQYVCSLAARFSIYLSIYLYLQSVRLQYGRCFAKRRTNLENGAAFQPLFREAFNEP